MSRLHDELFHTLTEFRKVPMLMSMLFDLPPGEFMTLKRLHGQNMPEHYAEAPRELNVSDLHGGMRMSMSAVSQTLASLERKGYVTRSMSEHDRRKIAVSLTPTGLEIVEQTTARMDEVMRRAAERFGEPELRELLAQAKRLSVTLDEVFHEAKEEMKGENHP